MSKLQIVSHSASTANQVFLPFEGDKTLVLILSQAFLLANDTAMTDEIIRMPIHQ